MRLLLDEHIAPRVAVELRRKGYDVVAAEELGTRGASDAEQLAAAARERRALVTYNIVDFQDLLLQSAQKGLTHQGIVFVSEKTVPQRSVRALVRALGRLLDDLPADDALVDRALFITQGDPAPA
ncbi:MAG: DUF5615 family PIN-like protein [Candidatus Rokubacteria bacterium]|nr:DUF5615 family PIN-like protein [Candidatus Rokubacteria bacterium]